MHGSQGDQIPPKTQPRQHSQTQGGNPCKRRPLLCVRVHGIEYISANERQDTRLPRNTNQVNNVLDTLRPGIYAQTWFLSQRLKTREFVGQR